ncbi:hypothetical protein D3C78_679230 [compost metagenome]
MQFPGFAAALLEPFEVDVPGDVLGDPLRALAVVHRDFLVHPVEVAGGLERTAANRQHRQSALEGAAAELHDPRVGHQVAAQQQPGQRHAVHGRQAGGEDDVVAVAGDDHQHTGLEQVRGVRRRGRAEDDLLYAPLFVVAGIQHARAEQVGDVAGAWGVQFVLPGDAAEQAELAVAQQWRMFLQAPGEVFGGGFAVQRLAFGVTGADLVDDHPEQLRIARPAEQVGEDLDAVGQFGDRLAIRRGNQDHFRIEAFRHVRVDPRGIADLRGRHHAFDDHHVLVFGGLLEAMDDFLQQLVELAFAEHALDLGQWKRQRRIQTVGAGNQFAGALRAFVALVRLGDRLVEADLQAGALQGADQAQAGGGEADAKSGRCDEEGMHPGSLSRSVRHSSLWDERGIFSAVWPAYRWRSAVPRWSGSPAPADGPRHGSARRRRARSGRWPRCRAPG